MWSPGRRAGSGGRSRSGSRRTGRSSRSTRTRTRSPGPTATAWSPWRGTRATRRWPSGPPAPHEAAAPLAGWVNNAALFRDAALHDTPAADVVALIAANLGLAVTGCAVAVRRFLAAGTAGAIVNVSSHQAQRPVPGALPYATAKAAIEGLTRALAVDYGPRGIRVNAVALGSVTTGRLEADAETAEAVGALHPLGRAGTPAEVAAVVAHLLGPGFVSGAVVPVDGGRAALGQDPEARRVV